MYKLLIRGIDSPELSELSRIKIYDVIRNSFKRFENKSVTNFENSFVFRNVILADGSNLDAWVEYTCDINRKRNVITFRVDQLIVYDQMPDYVLDRINELGIYKQGSQASTNDNVMVSVRKFMKWFKSKENAI